MRTFSRHLLLTVVGVFILISLMLYNSLETRSFKQKQSYLDEQLELQKLETEVRLLENKSKQSSILLNSMLKKVHLERQQWKESQDIFGGEAKKFEGRQEPVGRIRTSFMNSSERFKQKIEQLPVATGTTNNYQKQAVQGVIHPPIKAKGQKMNDEVWVDNFKQLMNRTSFISTNPCFAMDSMTRPDSKIQMLDMYSELPFDDPDGGVWKQGYDIIYDKVLVKDQKQLEVIVVPHSHNDPGWIKTFEEYYEVHTQNILNNMLTSLQKMDEMRFVYAEMSFFEKWWAEIDEKSREIVKQLLKSGKLEILTGGWVMPDEANSHYYAVISQLMEGHEWIQNHIGKDYKPKNHWSIDPFGLSPTIPYFMKMSNLSNGVVQRVHYSVKKYLAEKQELEFMWRQLWSGFSNTTDFTMHVMPFFSYDVPHTCGPDPKICCQFDFKRTAEGGLSCPWGIAAVDITNANIKKKAAVLYDQYRKKAQLFKTNVVLIPLGDDFRYDSKFEWNAQYENYIKLFKYMNAEKEWNVNARFGTLNDYFQLVHQRLHEDKTDLSVLSGDFFTYADRNDHYWSGYYTSRPFYKRLDRVLQHYVRTAEILYSFTKIIQSERNIPSRFFGLLVEARRWMSLFQHHDGVTGTSKTVVMDDYGKKMFTALKNSEEIILMATDILLRKQISPKFSSVPRLSMEQYFKTFDSLPSKRTVNQKSEMILFNSLENSRVETVCVHVNNLNTVVEIAGSNIPVLQQIGPLIEFIDGDWVIDTSLYELCFISMIEPLSFKKYVFKAGTAISKAIIRLNFTGLESSDFDIAPLQNFVVDNGLVSAEFNSETGDLKSVTLDGKKSMSINMSFVLYHARMKSRVPLKGSDNPPGAYIFLPDGPASTFDNHASFIVVEGSVMQKVLVAKYANFSFVNVIKLEKMSPSIEIQSTIHLQNVKNIELAMRLETGIDNGEEFFTDLNGYQLVKRYRFKQLPLQAHFYPMPTSAIIEDESFRMTLISAQPLGVANLASGQLDVMLDRRLNQDDGRGLFSGVTDNKKTSNIFRLTVEGINQNVLSNTGKSKRVTAYHSAQTYSQMLSLLYPIVIILTNYTEGHIDSLNVISYKLPCDIHLVTLRTLAAPTVYGRISDRIHSPENSYALVLHRFGMDCRFNKASLETCISSLNIKRLFTKTPSNVTETSLTMLYENLGNVSDVNLETMEVKTFRLDYVL